MPLIRVLKRAASIDEDDFRSFIESERLDIEISDDDRDLSVYLVAGNEIVQACSEHWASLLRPPLRPMGGCLDLHGLVEERCIKKTPGTTAFKFTREQHREVCLGAEELFSVLKAVYKERATRSAQVSRSDVRAFVREKLADNDEEWSTFVINSENGSRWKSDSEKV